MKALKPGAIATIAVAVSTLVCSRAAAQCPSPPTDPTTPQIHNIAVTLIDAPTPGLCVASNIKPGQPGYVIRTSNKGDAVNWNVTNNCSHDVTFAISEFRAKVPPLRSGDRVDNPLLEATGTLFVLVKKGGNVGVVTAHTNPGLNHYGRACTQYEYNFQERVNATPPRTEIIGDPQIEIPH